MKNARRRFKKGSPHEHKPDYRTLQVVQIAEDCVILSIQCAGCGVRGRTALLDDDMQWQIEGGPLDVEQRVDEVVRRVVELGREVQ